MSKKRDKQDERTPHLRHLRSTDEGDLYGGYGVVFGGVDFYGTTFTPDTDFMLDLVPRKLVMVEHGMASYVERDGAEYRLEGLPEPAGSVVSVSPDDYGLYMELMVERGNQYQELVSELVATGKAGLSSSTAGALVIIDDDGRHIRRWPIIEESITMTPAEPRTVAVERLRALAADVPPLQDALQEAGADDEIELVAGPAKADANGESESTQAPALQQTDERAAGTSADSSATLIRVTTEDTMTDKQPEVQERMDALETTLANVSKSVESVLELVQSLPAAKRTGVIAPDSERDHNDVRSFADFLIAVYRGNATRLREVYRSRPITGDRRTLGIDSGATGEWLVPATFVQEILGLAQQASPIVSRVTEVPVGTDSGEYPALDQTVTPTAGSGETALAAGVAAAITAPGATLTETESTFDQLRWNINKVGGFTIVQNELMTDSPFALETLLRQLFAVAIADKNERNILRGSGAGEPLGILNAACAIAITPDTDNTFAYADALEMLSRFKPTVNGNAAWLVHPSTWPDIGVFEVGTGGAVYQANVQAGLGAPLLGAPILQSQHLPQANNSGHAILADLSAYLFFMRSELSIAFSEHAYFTSDRGAWRFTQRNDGKPWLKNVITYADPQGSYTVSPFVYFND